MKRPSPSLSDDLNCRGGSDAAQGTVWTTTTGQEDQGLIASSPTAGFWPLRDLGAHDPVHPAGKVGRFRVRPGVRTGGQRERGARPPEERIGIEGVLRFDTVIAARTAENGEASGGLKLETQARLRSFDHKPGNDTGHRPVAVSDHDPIISRVS